MTRSTAFYQKNIPCLLAWDVLCPGLPLAQSHPLFALFLINLDRLSFIPIHSNPTKSNEIVRNEAKRNRHVKSYFAVYFFYSIPCESGEKHPGASWRLFAIFFVKLWIFLGASGGGG